LRSRYNPRIDQALHRLSRILREESDWIVQATQDDLEVSICGGDGKEELCLATGYLQDLAPAPCRRILRLASQRLSKDWKPLSYNHIEALTNLVKAGQTGKGLILPKGLRAYLTSDQLHLYILRHPLTNEGKSRLGLPPSLKPPGDYRYHISRPADAPLRIHIPEAAAWLICRIRQRADIAKLHRAGHHVSFFDMRELKFPLIVRNYRHGDRFRPQGLNGTQTIAKFFSNLKLAPRDRRTCPLLLSGETIIWVVGHRRAESMRKSVEARHLLEVRYKLA
jgi:tRNA(Ile)-lysidine synthase